MRWLSLLILFLLFKPLLRAQDTIVKRNGDRIISKVTEINPGNIRYKMFGNPEGPVYLLEKEQVKYVVYQNGDNDNFESYIAPVVAKEATRDLGIQPAGKYYYYKEIKITEPDMHAIVKRLKDPKLNAMIRGVENKKFIQDVLIGVSVPLFVSGIYVYTKNQPMRGRRGRPTITASQLQGQKTGVTLMLSALACDLVSVSFMLDRRRHNHVVVNAYNQKIAIGNP